MTTTTTHRFPLAGSPLRAGFVAEGSGGSQLLTSAVSGMLQLRGNDVRSYLVSDYSRGRNSYFRIDLRGRTLSFILDVSQVSCGCVASLSLLRLDDGAASSGPSVAGHTTRLELLQANRGGVQAEAFRTPRSAAQYTCVQTQPGGHLSGHRAEIGCAVNWRSDAPRSRPYGWGREATIDTRKPFVVHTSMSSGGALSTHLGQEGVLLPFFNSTSSTSRKGLDPGCCEPSTTELANREAVEESGMVLSLSLSCSGPNPITGPPPAICSPAEEAQPQAQSQAQASISGLEIVQASAEPEEREPTRGAGARAHAVQKAEELIGSAAKPTPASPTSSWVTPWAVLWAFAFLGLLVTCSFQPAQLLEQWDHWWDHTLGPVLEPPMPSLTRMFRAVFRAGLLLGRLAVQFARTLCVAATEGAGAHGMWLRNVAVGGFKGFRRGFKSSANEWREVSQMERAPSEVAPLRQPETPAEGSMPGATRMTAAIELDNLSTMWSEGAPPPSYSGPLALDIALDGDPDPMRQNMNGGAAAVPAPIAAALLSPLSPPPPSPPEPVTEEMTAEIAGAAPPTDDPFDLPLPAAAEVSGLVSGAELSRPASDSESWAANSPIGPTV